MYNEYEIEKIELGDDIINEYFIDDSNIKVNLKGNKKRIYQSDIQDCVFSIKDFEEVENDRNNFIVFDKYSKILSHDDWKALIKRKKKCILTIEEKELIIASLEQGIPNELRELIWKYLSKIDNLIINHNKDFYHNLFKIKNKKVETEIMNDVERSLGAFNKSINNSTSTPTPDLIKRDLYNILKAYSVYDSEIHYAQGTSFIVLIIVLNVKSQVDAFWLFVEIMIGKNWRGLFLEHTPGLLKIFELFVNKISLTLPLLYDHFEEVNVFIIFVTIFNYY